MNEDEDSERIGIRDIYKVLVVLQHDLARFGAASETAIKDVADHEDRIRALERWKYGLPIGALAALVPGIIALFK